MPRSSRHRYRNHARDVEFRSAARPVGPAAAFGRGRVVLTVMMLFLVATAYLARSRAVDDELQADVPGDVNKATANAGQENAPLVGIWDPLQKAAIAQRHGGVVRDTRAQAVQLVGAKIVSVIDPRFKNEMRFELLADETRAEAYVFRDGTIVITLGLARLTEYESEVAAALCESVERFVRSRDNALSEIAFGRLSAEWMQRAGFDPRDLEVLRQRIAARTAGRFDS